VGLKNLILNFWKGVHLTLSVLTTKIMIARYRM